MEALAVATSLGLVSIILSVLIARRVGLGQVQEKLIKTLQDTVAADANRYKQILDDLDIERTARKELEEKVSRMEKTILELVEENRMLRASQRGATA